MGERHGYKEVRTPQIFDSELWKTSGHWDKYHENMFVTRPRSARWRQADELPRPRASVRDRAPLVPRAAAALLASPAAAPLRAVGHAARPAARAHFAQDDAHIFCTEEQVRTRSTGCLDFAFATLGLFGFERALELSTRPENRIGSDEMWDRAEDALRQALEAAGSRTS